MINNPNRSHSVLSLDKRIGAKLRQLRQEKGLSQSNVSDKIYVSVQQISKYEKGTNRVSIDMFFKLCQIFEANPCEILAEINNSNLPVSKNSVAVIHLNRNFRRIKNLKVREAILKLVASLADETEDETKTKIEEKPKKFTPVSLSI